MNQVQYKGLYEEVKLKQRVWNKLVLKDVWRRQIKKKRTWKKIQKKILKKTKKKRKNTWKNTRKNAEKNYVTIYWRMSWKKGRDNELKSIEVDVVTKLIKDDIASSSNDN